MGLHLYTLSVILNSTCFASKKLSKPRGRKERSLPFAYSRLLWRCVIQTYCDVISENAGGQDERHFNITWSAAQADCGVILTQSSHLSEMPDIES